MDLPEGFERRTESRNAPPNGVAFDNGAETGSAGPGPMPFDTVRGFMRVDIRTQPSFRRLQAIMAALRPAP